MLQICPNSNSSKLSCMSSIPARMKKIQLKIKALKCSHDFSHYKSMKIFPDAQGQLTPQSLVRSGRISNSSRIYSNFSDAQGQITLVLVLVSGRNFNSSKLSCMSPLPARMRMIDSKMKELECSQDFSHYKSMGIFSDAQGQLTPQSLVRSDRISNSFEML